MLPTQSQYTQPITVGELLKFIGVLILGNRHEFGSRTELWSTTSFCRYIDAPKFGSKTGMVRDRFDAIFTNIRFSEQADQRPEGMSNEKYRWMLVDDFVKNFNRHRAEYNKPSHIICVDESISRWYGLGGSWINCYTALPMYVAQDRKPEDRCEIQNAADGVSGIMMQLKLVKRGRDHESKIDHDDALNHGTNVLLELVRPFQDRTRTVVIADSYFLSKQTARKLKIYESGSCGSNQDSSCKRVFILLPQ